MKIAYYGRNDQGSLYVNSAKHGFKTFEYFTTLVIELKKLRENGFLLSPEYKQNFSQEEERTLNTYIGGGYGA